MTTENCFQVTSKGSKLKLEKVQDLLSIENVRKVQVGQRSSTILALPGLENPHDNDSHNYKKDHDRNAHPFSRALLKALCLLQGCISGVHVIHCTRNLRRLSEEEENFHI